jgi:tRNA(Ile)-lysidine synthase
VKTGSPLLDKVHHFLHPFDLTAGMVVAVSGGADSVALLRALLAPSSDPPPGRLVVAHLNHQLRGGESDGDAAFVEELCHALQPRAPQTLRWRSERIDVAAQARKESGNLESVARRLRYAWLADVARQEQVPLVATGHTADDQAETVLHRLLRGTGLQGLRGIAPRRPLAAGVAAVRPLLRVTRAEVLAYLDAEGQPFREDRSNRDLRYTRNRIRHELLPYLAGRYNPAVVSILGRLAEGAHEVFQWYEASAAALLAEAELPRAGSLVVLDRTRMAAAPRHLVREALRVIWSREGWPLNRMDSSAWDRLAGVVFGERPALDLPGGIHSQGKRRVVQIGREC